MLEKQPFLKSSKGNIDFGNDSRKSKKPKVVT